MLGFGQVPTYQSNDKFELAVSDDKRAFTLTFSDLQVTVETSKSPAPIASRVFSLAVPLAGEEKKKTEIEFNVSAFVLTTEGATATMVFSVNGQTTVADFAANAEQSFLQKLRFTAEKPSECRLSVFLLVGQDSKNSNAAASLNVSAIDAEFLPRPA